MWKAYVTSAVLVVAFVALAFYAQAQSTTTATQFVSEVRMDYVQLGLWLAIGNAIGVPLGQAILGFLTRAWKNITE